jgi:hypothetical protein
MGPGKFTFKKTFTKLEAGKIWVNLNVACLTTTTNNKITIYSELL